MSPSVDPRAIPADVTTLCRELARAGYKGWVVGGCLRDLLRGRPAADWDLATSAHPSDVQRTFKRVIPTGIQHGTVTVRLGGNSYEVTTLRGEGAYSDGRRPDHVAFVDDIAADLARRDFTINAMAYDPLANELTDPFGGLEDLSRRVIRAVGRARERFSEDGLRVLRAARFAAALEFELEAETEAAIRPTLDTFRKVSAERVRDEWLKAFKARQPSRAFRIMLRTGILEVTSPFLAQSPALDAALAAVDLSPADANLRTAALFAGQRDDLPGLEAWLTSYRFSNQERALILSLVRHHAACWAPVPGDGAVRRFAALVGRDRLAAVLATAHVVAEGASDGQALENARAWERSVQRAVRSDTPLVAKELAVGGGELMKELGIKPGPALGTLIESLLARVIEDPSLNARDSLLGLARALSAES